MKKQTKVTKETFALLEGISKLEASNLLSLLAHDKKTAIPMLGLKTHYGSLYNTVCAIFEKSSQGTRDIMNSIKAIHETALVNSVYAFLKKFNITYELSAVEFSSGDKGVKEKEKWINADVAKNIYRTHKYSNSARCNNGYNAVYPCARQIEITKFN